VRVLDQENSGELELDRSLVSRRFFWSTSTKNHTQRLARHAKLLCKLRQRDAGRHKFLQPLQVYQRELPRSQRSVDVGSDLLDLLEVPSFLGEFQRSGPSTDPRFLNALFETFGSLGLDCFESDGSSSLHASRCVRLDETGASTFRTHSLIRLERLCMAPFGSHSLLSFADTSATTFWTEGFVRFDHRCASSFGTQSLFPFSNGRFSSRGSERLHCFTANFFSPFRAQRFLSFVPRCTPSGRSHRLYSFTTRDASKCASLFERQSAGRSTQSSVVPTRFVAIDLCGPLGLSAIGSGQTKNHANDFVSKTILSKPANSLTDQRRFVLLVPKSFHSSTFSRVWTILRDVVKVVHGNPHVLLPLGRTLPAASRVEVARVDVDGEPSLLRVPLHLDTAPKRLQNPHRSPSPQGGPRCLGARTPQAAFISHGGAHA
jgi:hypothetical protein